MIGDAAAVLKEMLGSLYRARDEMRRRGGRWYPGLERGTISRAARAELLLAQIQDAIEHQSSSSRPWQRYEPLWTFLDEEIWPSDETVQHDLSFAKLAIEILTEEQRRDLELALAE